MEEIELIERHQLFPSWILYVLLLTIVLLSILKYRREIVYIHLRAAFIRPPLSTGLPKEEIGFFGRTHWTLLINYFIVSGLAIYMALIYYQSNAYWIMLFPIAYYYLQLLEMYFVGLVAGEMKKVQGSLLLTNYTSHLLGVIFTPILLIWILNPHLSQIIIYIMAALFIFLQLVRIIRSISSALRNKILWYYIILYLCTFEIWPTLVIYLLLSSNFIG